MKTRSRYWTLFDRLSCLTKNFSHRTTCTGQALVEFTLCFLLMIVIAYIPADFGLAFYSSYVMGNAAREGARIAAADPAVDAQVGSCTPLSSCFSQTPGTLLYETAKRVPSALLSNGTINITTSGTTAGCNKAVQVAIQGDYNFFFYRMLRWFGATSTTGAKTMAQTYQMRYEHQC